MNLYLENKSKKDSFSQSKNKLKNFFEKVFLEIESKILPKKAIFWFKKQIVKR